MEFKGVRAGAKKDPVGVGETYGARRGETLRRYYTLFSLRCSTGLEKKFSGR
jgi:hypothetical protein